MKGIDITVCGQDNGIYGGITVMCNIGNNIITETQMPDWSRDVVVGKRLTLLNQNDETIFLFVESAINCQFAEIFKDENGMFLKGDYNKLFRIPSDFEKYIYHGGMIFETSHDCLNQYLVHPKSGRVHVQKGEVIERDCSSGYSFLEINNLVSWINGEKKNYTLQGYSRFERRCRANDIINIFKNNK